MIQTFLPLQTHLISLLSWVTALHSLWLAFMALNVARVFLPCALHRYSLLSTGTFLMFSWLALTYTSGIGLNVTSLSGYLLICLPHSYQEDSLEAQNGSCHFSSLEFFTGDFCLAPRSLCAGPCLLFCPQLLLFCSSHPCLSA